LSKELFFLCQNAHKKSVEKTASLLCAVKSPLAGGRALLCSEKIVFFKNAGISDKLDI
jgi:hypothetical protein